MQLFVARGAKHIALYPPAQSPNLYPAPQRLGERDWSQGADRIAFFSHLQPAVVTVNHLTAIVVMAAVCVCVTAHTQQTPPNSGMCA